MYIFISFISLIHCNQIFFERMDKLRECAKLFELSTYDSIPNQCLTYAKAGLSRTRRSTHLYSKPKEAKCQKPCQKARLYVKPKILKVLFDGYVPHKLDGRSLSSNEFLDIGEC